MHQWKVSCAVGHTFRSRSPAGAPGLATVLQTTPVWEEQRGRPERRRARSFTCAGKGKKKRDRALPSESARRIATSTAHEFAKCVCQTVGDAFLPLLPIFQGCQVFFANCWRCSNKIKTRVTTNTHSVVVEKVLSKPELPGSNLVGSTFYF